MDEGDRVRFRPGRPNEVDALHLLVVASKRSWGYDDAFMEQVKDDLRLPSDALASERTLVADNHGVLSAVAAWTKRDDGGRSDLTHLFVAPSAQRCGLGSRILMLARTAAARQGIRKFQIEADPNAASFYISMGAAKAGVIRSTLIPGRTLPLFELPTA